MTLLQYAIFLYLERNKFVDEKNMIKVSDLASLLDVKESVVIHDVSAMIFNAFNKVGKLTDGLITVDCKDKKVEENTSISINKNFSNINIKFSTIPMGNIKLSKTQEEKEAEEELKYKETYEFSLIDLAATRIMKGRIGKETKHSELVTEVFKQIETFVPKVETIKSRIESLIERKILKRTDQFTDMYEYIS